MKKLLLNNFKYFILIAVISTLFWCFLFNIITAPKDYEKMEIFITAHSIKKDDLYDKIYTSELKEIQINSCSENDDYYGVSLETLGIISSDILIVKKELVLTDGATNSFIELDKDYLRNYNINLEDFEVITVDNKVHAIVVYDKEKNINLLGDYIYYADDSAVYCIVLNNISSHIGKYSYKEKTTNIAFEMLNKLLYK